MSYFCVEMEDLLQRIRDYLSKGSDVLQNEYALYFSVITPLLQALGWNTTDPEEVVPQYATSEGRVDFALRRLDKHTGKRVSYTFIEVKHLGKADDAAEKQLFKYAFHEGVPLLVLTDGALWRFYHPLSAGAFSERMIEEISLLSTSNEVFWATLQKYLDCVKYTSLRDFHAFIQQEYNAHLQYRTFKRIWHSLLSGEDPALLNLLRERLSEHLHLSPDHISTQTILQWINSQQPLASPSDKAPTLPSSKGFYFQGKFYPARTLKELGRLLCEKLAEIDETFPERFYQSRENKGSTRTYVSQDANELYSKEFREKHPDWKTTIVSFQDKKGRQWWLMMHLSAQGARDLFMKLTKAVGLPWDDKRGVKVIV